MTTSSWDETFWRREGFIGFWTVGEWESHRSDVPTAPGLYVVLYDSKVVPEFLPPREDAPSKARGYAVDTLATRWLSHCSTLYIGQTQRSLRARLTQLVRQAEAQRTGRLGSHRGGRALWQIPEADALQIGWQVVPGDLAPAREANWLQAFETSWGQLPFANWNRGR